MSKEKYKSAIVETFDINEVVASLFSLAEDLHDPEECSIVISHDLVKHDADRLRRWLTTIPKKYHIYDP
jgi:hypothetical protein